MIITNEIPYQTITYQSQTVTVKRLDKVDNNISGNKFYKLYYNLQYAQQQGYQQVISFGGAYSNHIYALAEACHKIGLPCVGIIRGDELANKPLNPSLKYVQSLGMHLEFITRTDYRNKHTDEFLATLQNQYPNSYIIPEGGTNQLAIKGTECILSDNDKQNFDIICCAVGTGGTIAGIINTSAKTQQVIGFSALNTVYQQADIVHWTDKNNWQLYPDDRFGGYARYDQSLLDFIDTMKHQQQLPLEAIYTAKALYRLFDWLNNNHQWHGAKVLFIHTGGLQTYFHHN